jgi:hypothetical protein
MFLNLEFQTISDLVMCTRYKKRQLLVSSQKWTGLPSYSLIDVVKASPQAFAAWTLVISVHSGGGMLI